MNRHQVLTGAANSFDNSVSIGSVENNHFTVISFSTLFIKNLMLFEFIFIKGVWIRL